MTSDQKLRTLINSIVTDQRVARRFMSRLEERSATSRLNISDDPVERCREVFDSVRVCRASPGYGL
jgi:hypothetical protein